jgi:hypothetical protein
MTIRLTATAATVAALALAACGKQAELHYPAGSPGPATPTGSAAPPTPADLVAPTPQSRPQRSDELLSKSQERQSDEFDLPPS